MVLTKEEKRLARKIVFETLHLIIFVVVAIFLCMFVQYCIGFITGIFIGYEATTENFIELLNSNLTKEQIIQVI